MSDLARSFAKTKLTSLPPEAPLAEEEREDDSSSASSMSSVGTIRPSSSHKPANRVSWADFFSQELYLEQKTEKDHAKYHVYYTPPASLKLPLLVLHHGAGSSGLSFGLFARDFRKLMPDTGILCLEARDHGSVVWRNDTGDIDTDLSIDTLSQDMADMIHLTQAKLGWADLPEMMLVGHSLGGAVVTNTAKKGLLGNKVLGYAVLDVVEGSAMDALKSMQSYLATRPSVFPTLADAIDWHIRSRTLRNIESARASVPPLLLQTSTGKWIWRTDLSKTEAYWEDWFGGMSSKFLNARGAKLLLLAGTDRLDKELMIGQMQGKFQLQVLPAAGHFIQEDLPEKTAEIIVEFLKRNDRSALVLPPKVSDLLAQGKKV
ncbi:protein phosphatase methylesteras-like protein 1 [Rhizodiscina lignyota]|uniref:Protein phosphatase methylesterase 1 n=1 Tax=Rhizodiscina lignyota TaxID=1504668 RepID=A0A9P4M4A4_9PEZI|nr:protein phosphatase methylesteras-like protein 1 [Rhizodiscina lignyota]